VFDHDDLEGVELDLYNEDVKRIKNHSRYQSTGERYHLVKFKDKRALYRNEAGTSCKTLLLRYPEDDKGWYLESNTPLSKAISSAKDPKKIDQNGQVKLRVRAAATASLATTSSPSARLAPLMFSRSSSCSYLAEPSELSAHPSTGDQAAAADVAAAADASACASTNAWSGGGG
jgi:hypothetical protein